MNHGFCTVNYTRPIFEPVICRFIEIYFREAGSRCIFVKNKLPLMSKIRINLILFLSAALLTGVIRKASAQTQTARLAIYCKVWGFIKYHHPNVAGGTINWDSVFIAHIDPVIAATNGLQLNAELAALIA